MKRICLVCKQESEVPGESKLVTHGLDSTFCERVLNDWSDDPQDKTLPEYYQAVLKKTCDVKPA